MAVFVDDEPRIRRLPRPLEPRMVKQQHLVRIVLNSTAAHETLGHGPFGPVARGLAVELGQRDHRDAEIRRQLPDLMAHRLNALMDRVRAVRGDELQVVHHEVLAVTRLMIEAHTGQHIVQLGQRLPVDQDMASHRPPHIVHEEVRPPIRLRHKPRSLL